MIAFKKHAQTSMGNLLLVKVMRCSKREDTVYVWAALWYSRWPLFHWHPLLSHSSNQLPSVKTAHMPFILTDCQIQVRAALMVLISNTAYNTIMQKVRNRQEPERAMVTKRVWRVQTEIVVVQQVLKPLVSNINRLPDANDYHYGVSRLVLLSNQQFKSKCFIINIYINYKEK